MSVPDSVNEREYRLVDQAVSMHSQRRDELGRRALLLNSTLIGLSVLLNAFVFGGQRVFQTLGLDAELAGLGLGLVSIGVLIASVVELRVDWSGESSLHARAATRWSELKHKYQEAYANNTNSDEWEASKCALSQAYRRVCQEVVAVPERHFNRLKGKHLFKIELSKATSAFPRAPHWLLRLVLQWCGGRDLVLSGRRKPDQDQDE